ncbi:MAG: hypothetical protein N4A39_07340 [Roseicyclus sp.]|jgi:hypothetical protein|nr:hypothetical protein [Roseicyclus sp.]
MFWTLVTVLFSGLAGAGIGLALRSLSRGRLPKGIMPVSAGLTMLAATVALEYQWADGVRDTMAEDLVIISTREQRAWYQPWTMLRPWVRGFIAYSPSETVETAPGSGISVVQLRIQERWNPQVVRPALVDCAGSRWTDLTATTEFTEAGIPVDTDWRTAGPEDPIIAALCDRETAEG